MDTHIIGAPHRPLPPELRVQFAGCPVKASLDVLGRKWALLILRNIGLYRTQRFNQMLRVTPGLTKRVLAMRLRELEHGGFIHAVERGRNYTRWGLTDKGDDALPILMALVHFGSKWYANEVFADQRPRALSEVFESSYIQKTLREMMTAGLIGGTPEKGSRLSTPGGGLRRQNHRSDEVTVDSTEDPPPEADRPGGLCARETPSRAR
jgi:DNA-binding HxlR family transcriptional regulator